MISLVQKDTHCHTQLATNYHEHTPLPITCEYVVLVPRLIQSQLILLEYIRTRQLSQYCTSFLLDDMLRQQSDSDPVELGFSLSQWKQVSHGTVDTQRDVSSSPSRKATDALAFLVKTVAQYNSSSVYVEFTSPRTGLKVCPCFAWRGKETLTLLEGHTRSRHGCPL